MLSVPSLQISALDEAKRGCLPEVRLSSWRRVGGGPAGRTVSLDCSWLFAEACTEGGVESTEAPDEAFMTRSLGNEEEVFDLQRSRLMLRTQLTTL